MMMISAKISIAAELFRLGKIVVNTVAPATNAEATYTVKHTRKITAQMICSAGFFVLNRLDRYCGSVMASSAASLKQRRRRATMIQFAAVPSARPMPIHIWPKPNASMLPGKPISIHADISEACADIAVTQGPIERPPRKYSFSPAPFSLKKKSTPMPSISTKYRTNATTSRFILHSPLKTMALL